MTPDKTPQSTQSLSLALEGIFESFEADASIDAPPAAQKAARLARVLQQRALELQTPQEKRQQAELERMMQNPGDKTTLIQMTDQSFRSDNPHRAVDQMTHILDVQGVPRFFTPVERTLLKGFQSFGSYLPGVALPLVKDKMREETANVILPAEDEILRKHLDARRDEGVRMNVNFLGEALLGEDEAQVRLESYLSALQHPEIECISVKISTIYSQISSIAFEHTVRVLCDRLELLYRAASKERFRRADGSEVPKFVYLDMEEYRDLAITAEVFLRTLERPGLQSVLAGIALQAYVPDSFLVQKRINEWARRRVEAGGAPVTIRVVKGANMEMERVEASLAGWPQAPYQDKVDTDANFKRMLDEGFRPENLAAVRLGIASHNLFDIAYGLVLAVDGQCLDQVQFEMLEGMANHQRRALFELSRNLLLYAPATRRENFIHAIGYLIRRLDENTGPDNFLRHTFKLTVGSAEWKRLEEGFFEAFRRRDSLRSEPRRTQNRRQPAVPPPTDAPFDNEPDTDFCLPQNIAWAEGILENWRDRCGEAAVDVPLVIDGTEIRESRDLRESKDPSRPGVVVARYRQGSEDDARSAVESARSDPSGWREKSVEERSLLLAAVAQELRLARADLMGAALADGGKTLRESDPEVSEAIDFCEYYRRSAVELSRVVGLESEAKGVVVVVPPWNFPIAIPCGGVAAALAAGNTVILKPSSDTVLVAWELCQAFWRAGVSRQALQFLPCSGASVGAFLVAHPDVDSVILTGGTDTALRMLDARPDLDLYAETGGKNATVVTALADRELAIQHILHSAFGHSGQKCSATSLLVLEQEVFHDQAFRESLEDAVRSLCVGSAWDLSTKMGPMVHPPSGDLETGLKELESGESWAVMPRQVGDNPCLWSPGLKWGVRPGSYTHCTEFFGPVLAVLEARDLNEAISITNGTGYGLTSGIESLDDREQRLWRDSVRAGNLYINRPTTGAIVLRQPFGGMGKSAFGPGIKAGGPNYVAQFLRFRAGDLPPAQVSIVDEEVSRIYGLLTDAVAQPRLVPGEPFGVDEIRRLQRAIESYQAAWNDEFGRVHDEFQLVGQDNLRRYLAVDELRVRLDPRDAPWTLWARVAAARIAGCRVTVSSPHDLEYPALAALERITEMWGARIEFLEESDEELALAISEGHTQRVRYEGPDRAPESILRAVGDSGVWIARSPVLPVGRVELLWYLREQSISHDYNRYGNLGKRARESRRAVL